MGTRVTKETMYLKYEFNDQEKLLMANTLASNHNAIDDIDAEEAVFKSQIKERRSGLAQSIQSLSRNISMGFEMRNIPCAVQYDTPNINEITYVRLDTGDIAKTRPMSESERQQELEFREVETEPAEASVSNIADFFGSGEVEVVAVAAPDDPEAVFSDSNPDANLEAIKPEHDADWGVAPTEAKRGRGRPRKDAVTVEASEPF